MNRVFKNELAKNEVPEMQQIIVTQPKSVLQQVANAASSTEATQELASSKRLSGFSEPALICCVAASGVKFV